MPCDYKKDYAENWLTEIRPAILDREGNCCKVCGALNGSYVFRGEWKGKEIFQNQYADIYETATGKFLIQDAYALINPSTKKINQKAVKIVLTIAHLDHNTKNNDYLNLAALYQLHHLRHDVGHHKQSRKNKRGLQELNFEPNATN